MRTKGTVETEDRWVQRTRGPVGTEDQRAQRTSVPLVLCAHCSTGPLCPLFLWSPVSTVPLFHCSTVPRVLLCHWSTVPRFRWSRFIGSDARFIGADQLFLLLHFTTNSLCLPLVLCAHCLLTLCIHSLYPSAIPIC